MFSESREINSYYSRIIRTTEKEKLQIIFLKKKIVKEAALYSLLLIYILHIDLIRNVMHNIYTYVH